MDVPLYPRPREGAGAGTVRAVHGLAPRALDEHAEHAHAHGEGCGHVTVPHGDHTDYVHDGHRHAAHEGHWDDH
ncbi:hypothetical protein [Streptomyces flaveolus]|uniref:hypothetical protein n=1 Tax=Streptomyces flaveolus TaxID=67297 RepID=UPI0036FA597C